ncbi:MAG: hypothetical protein M3364_04480, partial [Actinomycetota bacterium]|nr:hypothetical protein [Actinomycetota bacterium]
MRAALTICALAAVLALLPLAAAGSSAVSGKIRVTATTYDVRVSDGGPAGRSAGDLRIDLLLLWNNRVSDVPIGHAFVSCGFLGRGGLLGSGVSACQGTFVLPRGSLVTQGIRHSSRRYTFAVTG